MRASKPKLKHVRFTTAKGKLYAYFDTGNKKPNGRPLYVPLGRFERPGFYEAYAGMLSARKKRTKVVYTVADFWRDYEKSPAFLGLAKSTQVTYSLTGRKISGFLGEFPVDDLSQSDIMDVLENDIEGTGNYNMFLACIGAMYAWGRSPEGRNRTDREPTKDIRRLKSNPYSPWPDEIVEAALQSEDDAVRLAVHLLYFTGQRIGDVLAMRWPRKLDDNVIKVVQQKGKKTVWIPFLDELRSELDKTPKRGMTILSDDRGRKLKMNALREKLQEFTADRGTETVPHGLRKNAVNALLLSGCTIAETASITGQSYGVVEHYAKQINQRNMAEAAIVKFENKRKTRKQERKPA